MAWLEVQEGAVRMRKKPWCRQLGATAACVRRAVDFCKKFTTLHEVDGPPIVHNLDHSEDESTISDDSNKNSDDEDEASVELLPETTIETPTKPTKLPNKVSPESNKVSI